MVYIAEDTIRSDRLFVPTLMRLVRAVEGKGIRIEVREVSSTLWSKYFHIKIVGTEAEIDLAQDILNSCD